MRLIGSRVIIVLILAGCQAPLPEPAPRRPFTPPPPVTEFLVKETRLVNGVVTVRLDIPMSPVGPKPTVIALIGDSHPLLDAGFVAVTYNINWALLKTPTPSPPPPGPAVGKWVLASPSAAVLGELYLRRIAATATEYLPVIIDWLETVPDVDATRIGMVGGSTNGFVTLQAVAAERRIRAAVAIAACGDYHRFLRYSSMGMEGKPLELDPSYERWIRSQEIMRSPRRVVHAALLMVNRVPDKLVPISCADETARMLAPAYQKARAGNRFRYVRIQGGGHASGPEERGEMLAWFLDWLQGR